MKQISIFLIILFHSLFSFAQPVPVWNVQSPEIANLGVYGNIPVSHYTGVPEISIPLYEIKVGNYILPLSANYHLASVKPDQQPGCLGMGWSLFAGGYITRAVNSCYDEKCSSGGHAFGYYSNANMMNNISTSSFDNSTLHHMEGDNSYELSADEFSFNFCGYTGCFYYNASGGWTVVSDYDISVEFNPNEDGFISRDQLKDRINMTGWTNKSNNNRFFNKFTLITPDGCRYIFGGIDATEYSVNFYARNASDLIPTTWRLSKIVTADKREISFQYDPSSIMCDIRYDPSTIQCNNNLIQQSGLRGYTGFLLFPVNLLRIITPNERIEFKYSRDSAYGEKFCKDINTLYYEGRTQIINYFTGSKSYPADQFLVFLKNAGGLTLSERRESIKNSLTYYFLNKIIVYNTANNIHKKIQFSYVLNNRRKLLRIEEISGSPSLKNDETVYDTKRYSFKYNSTTMPSYYVAPASDSWGYYIGYDNVISHDPSFNLSISPLQYTRAETLEEITYPTGGKTQFSYEQHTYSKVVSDDHLSLLLQSGLAGGLRVNEIRNIDINGAVINKKKYYYSATRVGQSSGIVKGIPRFSLTYSHGDNYITLKSVKGFSSTATSFNTPDVGYSYVIEETLDKNNNSLGYIRYRYSNYDADNQNTQHMDEKAFHSVNLNDYDPTATFTSHAMERGKLLTEEYYDTDGNLVKKIENQYSKVCLGQMVTGSQRMIVFPDFNPVTAYIGWLNYTYTYRYFPTTKFQTWIIPETNGSRQEKTIYAYNNSKQIVSVKETTSKNGERITYYKYPSDDTSYAWMTTQHLLSPVIEKSVTEEGKMIKETYSYQNTNGIPYISLSRVHYSNNSGLGKVMYKVTKVDGYGNPIEYEENGMTSVLIWGGYGQLLRARIDNATVSELEEIYGFNISNQSDLSVEQSRNIAYESIIYSQLKSQLHIYNYDENMRVVSITNPNTFTIYFKYDGLDRLREKYYFEKKQNRTFKRLLEAYDYHFVNGD